MVVQHLVHQTLVLGAQWIVEEVLLRRLDSCNVQSEVIDQTLQKVLLLIPTNADFPCSWNPKVAE